MREYLDIAKLFISTPKQVNTESCYGIECAYTSDIGYGYDRYFYWRKSNNGIKGRVVDVFHIDGPVLTVIVKVEKQILGSPFR